MWFCKRCICIYLSDSLSQSSHSHSRCGCGSCRRPVSLRLPLVTYSVHYHHNDSAAYTKYFKMNTLIVLRKFHVCLCIAQAHSAVFPFSDRKITAVLYDSLSIPFLLFSISFCSMQKGDYLFSHKLSSLFCTFPMAALL